MKRSDEIPGTGGLTTLGSPPGPGPYGGFSLPYPMDAPDYGPLLRSVETALSRREPCVLIIKKLPKSLTHTGSRILGPLFQRLGPNELPTLVLDDECDEGSVPGKGDPRVIPELIAGLWNSSPGGPQKVAYVGYTATAAAALLQDPENELFPSHFVQLLRYPTHESSALSYMVPNADDRYSGTTTYYEVFGDEPGEDNNFLINTSMTEHEASGKPEEMESLVDAVIAYFVAGAFRLALNPNAAFDDPSRLPPPHSMIVQASAAQAEHRRYASAISAKFSGRADASGVVTFTWDAVEPLFRVDPSRWQRWYSRFDTSRRMIDDLAPHSAPHLLVPVTWEEVKGRLPAAVANTKLKLVNSDPVLGNSLDYTRPRGPDGKPGTPRDIFTIAVGGGILSRGLTIEGLCISFYTRDADRPLEDTTMQMSRWLGYRGTHLEFCRVFTTPATYQRLKAFHENDIQHRSRLAALMQDTETVDRARIALQTLPSALLTAKIGIGKTHDIAFSPFTHVFDRVEIGPFAIHDQELAKSVVDRIRARNAAEVTVGQGAPRGILSRGWSAAEVADVLDSWLFTEHNPDPADYPHAEFHKARDVSRAVSRSLGTRNDPYLVAAYLRRWGAQGAAPRFNFGITFGSRSVDSLPFDFPLLDRAITNGHLVGGWSGASAGWPGDKYFDQPPSGSLDGAGERGEGVPGLILLHVIHKSATGRSTAGQVRQYHTVSFGISIPAGGTPFSVVVNYDRD